MLSSTACRKRAQQKIVEAERNSRHSKRLIAAAEAWLALAMGLKYIEACSSQGKGGGKAASVARAVAPD